MTHRYIAYKQYNIIPLHSYIAYKSNTDNNNYIAYKQYIQ